jgi:crossover junction endodeoxyribonuclease RusA
VSDANIFRLELPFPPSTNTYWRHVAVGGRPRTLISAKGRIYREYIRGLCLSRAVEPMTGELACTLDLHPPCNRRRDVDNYCKALLDALEHAGIYANDSQIKRLQVVIHDKSDRPRCNVALEVVQ